MRPFSSHVFFSKKQKLVILHLQLMVSEVEKELMMGRDVPCGHIDKFMNAQTAEEVKKNGLRLTTIIESIYWLCLQGYALRGHDESSYSKNQGAAEKESSIWLFFSKLTSVCNLIKASPKRHTELQSAQAIEIANIVATGIRETVTGLNHIGTLQRAGKTRWSSHFESICSMIDMYKSVIIVLEHMVEEASSNSIRGEATGSLIVLKSFDFIFILYLMHKIMAITYLLCRALQEKSLEIVNAMDLVSTTKVLLHTLREEGYDILLMIVQSVCENNGTEIPDMNACYRSVTRRSCQKRDSITFEHHYCFDVFNASIDFQVEELNSRFDDGDVELLRLSFALEPRDNFKLFNADDIYNLAEKFYPETEKAKYYHSIDKLIRRVLTLLIFTATTERSFSAMKLLITSLRNKMEEELLADSMIVYIEREFTAKIDTDSIIDEFYSMKNRMTHLQ
ncbi:uncharacterized protein [Henckelia pumila]|uniref:uncharacterized protein n=1 Tax=Henckelia pumila TaxID=405737 RepID=UPI003C6E7A27